MFLLQRLFWEIRLTKLYERFQKSKCTEIERDLVQKLKNNLQKKFCLIFFTDLSVIVVMIAIVACNKIIQ